MKKKKKKDDFGAAYTKVKKRRGMPHWVPLPEDRLFNPASRKKADGGDQFSG